MTKVQKLSLIIYIIAAFCTSIYFIEDTTIFLITLFSIYGTGLIFKKNVKPNDAETITYTIGSILLFFGIGLSKSDNMYGFLLMFSGYILIIISFISFFRRDIKEFEKEWIIK